MVQSEGCRLLQELRCRRNEAALPVLYHWQEDLEESGVVLPVKSGQGLRKVPKAAGEMADQKFREVFVKEPADLWAETESPELESGQG